MKITLTDDSGAIIDTLTTTAVQSLSGATTEQGISPQRLAVALRHADDDKTEDLMRSGDIGEMEWKHVANLLACDLQQVYAALAGLAVFDYQSQKWLTTDNQTT